MRRTCLTLSIAGALSTAGSGLAIAQSITRTPPPVVWEIESRIWQEGWNGLSDPTHVWRSALYTKTTSNGVGGYAVDTTSQSWDLSWLWAGGHPSSARTLGRLGPSTLGVIRTIGSDWSSNFIIEDAYASLVVRAWVRGGAGTEYRIAAHHLGIWNGRVQDSGWVRLSGLGRSETSCTNCSVAMTTQWTTLPGFIVIAQGPTRVFDEYPGVVYTRVQWPISLGAPSLNEDAGRLHHYAGESCILGCGPRTEVDGSGAIASRYQLWIEFGVTPQFVSAPPSRPRGYRGRPVGLAMTAFDPDNVGIDDDGILDYEWRVNDEIVQFGEFDDTLVWTPEEAGLYTVQLSVSDDEGMMTTARFDIEVLACLADWNDDGGVTSQDFFDFLTSFLSSDIATDINNDRVIDSQDFLAFVVSFFSGC